MRLRPYTPVDRDACLHLFDTNVGDFFVEEERAGFEEFLDGLPGPYFVGEEDGEVVACGGYAVDEDGEADLCWAVRLQTIPATEGFFHRVGFETRSVEPDGFGPGMDRVAMRMELDRSSAASGVEGKVPEAGAP